MKAKWLEGSYAIMAASEESARLGHPEIDVDHLLLGLLLTGGQVSRRAADAGLTVASARAALERRQRTDLALLGLEVGESPTREHRPFLGAGSRLAPRAEAVLRTTPPGESGLLVALLDESSGTVTRLLQEAGVDPARLTPDRAENSSSTATRTTDDPHRLAVEHRRYLGADPAVVWALLADPQRRPDWDPDVAEVLRHDETELVVRLADRRRSVATVAVCAREPGAALRWRTEIDGMPPSWLDARLVGTGSGTDLRLTMDTPVLGRSGRLARPLIGLLSRHRLRLLGVAIAGAL